MRWDSVVKTLSGTAGVVVGFLYSEISKFMALDYITGIFCGI